MSRSLLQMFSPKCRHEFAWPRKGADGDYYQVCVNCGEEYQYDWPSMRRLGKRAKPGQQAAGAVQNEKIARKTSWSPRARRIKSPIPVQLRAQGASDLCPATIENISQSGLFLTADPCPAKNEVLEMIFEMPIEISGQRNSKVLCTGQVVRIATQPNSDAISGFAVAILDYHFLHGQERKQAQTGRRSPQKTLVQ